MFGQIWNNETIRKYVIYFGTLFNQVYVQRDDSNGNVVQTMKVPLHYGPRDKFLARLDGNPSLTRPIAITLPRMSFEIINISYDPTRKLTTTGMVTSPDSSDPNKARYQYNPVPYDLEFSLYIMVKNQEDGTRIVEQILPFFTPEFTATLNLNPDLGIKHDIPLILNSVSQEDTYEGNFETRRAIIWTLSFTMKAYMFGPSRSRAIIKEIDLNYRPTARAIDLDLVDPADPVYDGESMQITPGLYANGSPANWYGDATAAGRPTVQSTTTVSSDDNYGFMVDFVREN